MNILSGSRVILLLIFSLGYYVGAHGQNRQIDSLNRLLKIKREVPVLCELARENIMLENFESALQLADEALVIALKESDSLGIVMAHRFRGGVFRRREQLDKALEEILPAFEIAERHNYLAEIKFLMNSIAIIYTNKAQYDKALDFYFKTLALREVQGDQSEISITLNNIAVVYSNLKNYKKALKFYNNSLIAKKKANDNYDLDKLLINIGLSEIELGEFENGAKHVNEGFGICKNLCSDEIKMIGERGLGLVKHNLKELDESLKHYTISYTLAKKNNNQQYQSNNLISLGRIAMRSGNLNKAEKLLKNAETIADKAGYNQLLIDTYKELVKLYSLRREEKKEILYLKKYVYLSDSLISLDLVKNIATIQSRFDERENIKNIKTLEENIVLKNEAIARQQLLNIMLGSAAVLLVIIGILIYRLYALRNKSNKQLDDKVRQRTQQLQEGQIHLQSVLSEQNIFMENIREEMRALTTTIKGIGVIGKRDVFIMEEFQIMAVENTTYKLDAIVEQIDKKRSAIP